MDVNAEKMEYVCWWMIAAFLFLPPSTNLALVSVRDFNDVSFSETTYRNQFMGFKALPSFQPLLSIGIVSSTCI